MSREIAWKPPIAQTTQNIWNFIDRKSNLQEMANFGNYPGRFQTLIWRPGETVQNLESPGLSRKVDSPEEVSVCLKRGTCGFTVLHYWAFFKLYCGNFDFNVRCWGIIQPCGMQFFILLAKTILHSIAVPFIWPLLSHVGQYLEDFRHNGKWLHNIVTVTLSWNW